jgi:hypothetical protein
MDMNALINNLLVTDNPVLPNPEVMRVALQVIWALVLGSGAALLARKVSSSYRLALVALVMLWTLLPSSASPAYWLGLAFQAPSLLSGAIALIFLRSTWRDEPLKPLKTAGHSRTWLVLLISAVVLGWLLLLDTLAWLPVSIYAWGFGTAAFTLLAVCVVLLWVFSSRLAVGRSERLSAPALVLGVLTLFVLTRLPTGNVWDALMDPWLWVALNVLVIAKAVRWLKTTWRRAPPIRA